MRGTNRKTSLYNACDKWLAKQSGTLPGGPEKGVLKPGGMGEGPGEEVFQPGLAGEHPAWLLE